MTSLKLRAIAVEEAPDASNRVATAALLSADSAVEEVETALALRARFDGISALVSGDAERLKSASKGLADVAESIQDIAIRTEYVAFGTLLGAMHRLVEWKGAVRSAEADADRYRKAAVLAAKDLPPANKRLAVADLAERIMSVGSTDDVSALIADAIAVRLPVPLSKDRYPRRATVLDSVPAEAPRTRGVPAVAFARFEYEGRALDDPQVVTPRTIHEVTVDITLSNWPEGAERVVVDALSIVPRASYDMPRLTLTRPIGPAPYHWREKAKFVIRDAQSLETGPLEFQYRAYAEPESGERDVVLEGQRSVNLYAYDAAMHPQTGFAEIDQKLLAIRTAVRRAHVPESDIAPFMRLMTALGSIAGRAIAGDLFPGPTWPERNFQRDLADKLRTDPRIGSDLEEHPSISGGTTDLSLQRVRLELKVEGGRIVTVEDARSYSEQEAQYVAGSDRRLGAICILDASEKCAAPGMPANDVDVLTIESPTGGAPMMLGVVILRGNLRRPSDYSK